MGFGGGGGSSAAAPAPAQPVGVPKTDPNVRKAVKQNRTEASPIGRPLLTPEQADSKQKKDLLG